ncbi:Methionyl-tRNA formyltransferase [uncultured Candidatus Thioglobus sp.]|nr:Methionyl-tRNA formyltransferase [uncultured Candidatus Thioglobus sp.]
MRIVFAGTPDFSVNILVTLINAGHQIVGVYCQPDRPKGRGRTLSACAVKEKALEHNLLIFQPESLKGNEVQQNLAKLNAEVMVVVAYGQLLPKSILTTPKYGCLNIHASLLPRWRGAAPIQRAILAGDKITGIGIMQMDEGLDTGDVLLEKTCEISSADTAQSLHDKLAILGADAIIEALENLSSLSPKAQNEADTSYAKKLKKQEAWIDWTQSAVQINQQIRAFNPYPIAQIKVSSDKFNEKVLRILSAEVVDANGSPGEIIQHDKTACIVATDKGALSLKTVQLSGKKVVNIKDFSNAYKLDIIHSYLG